MNILTPWIPNKDKEINLINSFFFKYFYRDLSLYAIFFNYYLALLQDENFDLCTWWLI